MAQNRVLAMLGLAKRAGKVESGSFMTERAIKEGRAFCVLLAADASANTKKDFQNMCAYYEVPLYEAPERAELGHAIGSLDRVVVAVTDEGFARQIRLRLGLED